MRKLSVKLFYTIMLCSVSLLLCLGSFFIVNMSKEIKENKNDELVWMARSYAAEISTNFSIIEMQVKELESFIYNNIDYNRLKTDKNYLAEFETPLDAFVKEFASQRASGVAGWVFFDPQWSDTPHDVYYVDDTDNGTPDRQKYIPFDYYDNNSTEKDDKYWWYGPQEKQVGIWTNPYDWQLKTGKIVKVVSYSVPIYIQGDFIGVVGSYYRFDDMIKNLRNIQVFDSGLASLYNEKLDIIVHAEYFAGTRETSDNIKTINDGKFAYIADAVAGAEYGICNYEKNGEAKVLAFAHAANGWVLGLDPVEKEMYQNIYDMMLLLLTAIIICIGLSALFATYWGRRMARPIEMLTQAAKKVGEGDLSVKISLNSNDEIEVLGGEFNKMLGNVQKLTADLEKIAYYDELTGIRNLVKFKQDAQRLLEENPNKKFAILKCDILDFKIYNEMYGFAQGDAILKLFASITEKMLDTQYELVGRVTADEFVVFLRFTNMQDFKQRQIIHKEVYEKAIGEKTFKITMALGRYIIEPGECDMTNIFERVNLAHRMAKQMKEAKICDYDINLRQITMREKAIEAQQEFALLQNEFVMYLQPKYALKDEAIQGAEALVRWNSSAFGMLYPNDFIPLFEKNGFILKMDMYMFEKACKTIHDWIVVGITLVPISVNFARIHFSDTDFAKKLVEIADKYNVPHNLLEIEVTETAIFENIELFIKLLEQLHHEGFLVSMDDFGTGYSSLGLLKNVLVDVIKLDRSFFVGALDKKRERAIIASVIDMAHVLNITTVAEGVEDIEHINFLRSLKCDVVQGYYYSKPVPLIDFLELLK